MPRISHPRPRRRIIKGVGYLESARDLTEYHCTVCNLKREFRYVCHIGQTDRNGEAIQQFICVECESNAAALVYKKQQSELRHKEAKAKNAALARTFKTMAQRAIEPENTRHLKNLIAAARKLATAGIVLTPQTMRINMGVTRDMALKILRGL